MSKGEVTAIAGPSNPAPQENRTKRARKRLRNKKRTTQVEDSSSSSSDDSDEEEEKPKAAAIQTEHASSKGSSAEEPKRRKKGVSVEAAVSDKEDDDEEGGEGADAEGKRKRKRKRNTKKKATEDTPKITQQANKPSALTTMPPTALSPADVGPDPNTDLRLSDQAKQAIQYAQTYAKDKAQWKFNKAKQNWLLRNALSVPPSDYDPALARKQPADAASAEGAASTTEEAQEGENFVPEDFVLVVTTYLNSVMGGARQRLIESLKEAVNAPAMSVDSAPTEVTDGAANANIADEEGTSAKADGTVTKSVSFGNLALETEKKEEAAEAAEAAGPSAGTDARAVELRRARATQMLQRMGEAL